jgi:hypothetical protein
MKHRVTRSTRPKLWYRWHEWAQMGVQPSGRRVTFERYYGAVSMSVYEGGRMIAHTSRKLAK